MLGRAKWDAWAKHKDLDSFEAKWLYVEALLKVLRKYSDKTIARDLVAELESYGGDPSNLVMSRSFGRSSASETTGSTASDDGGDETDDAQRYNATRNVPRPQQEQEGEESGSEGEETDEDEARDLPPSRLPASYDNRPQSSLSSNRYRTPMAGSTLMSPPPDTRLPQTQPHPGFETPSAFAPPVSSSYPSHLAPNYTAHPDSFSPSPHSRFRGQYGHDRPPSRPTLEYAIENVQSHLAALTERIESLENRMLSRSRASVSPRGGGNSPRWFGNNGSPPEDPDAPRWDVNDLGLWSLVLNPLFRGMDHVRDWATFFARDENRSPARMIVRRLVLDVSFLVCVVAVIGAVWRRSGVRRREVKAALVVLWRALIGGSRRPRTMVDHAV
ncbi:hypothetical protein EST38_g44 [Candolleomyces aberdarensis]|uniref:ACB domain-containing protein n=1 Tax=Candolleomyces aberdarensis TaxID=2316362 RepID=A0A4V1Q5J7_9AGAR|nr:hypothetical protein EST38_g44 [Candolleomyces aberdarensis]